MSVADPNASLELIEASLRKKLPKRFVQRSLPADPAALPEREHRAGVIAIVCEGGGDFANYMGREGDLGTMSVALAGFIVVDEKSPAKDIEVAELALLKDLLDWTNDQGAIRAGDSVLPTDFTLSKQLEHPFGWVVLKLEVRP